MEGLAKQIMRRYEATSSEQMRDKYRKYFREAACHDCGGVRLRKEARSVYVGKARHLGRPRHDHHRGRALLRGDRAPGRAQDHREELLKEISHRLTFLSTWASST